MRNSREEDIKLLEEFSNENVLYGSTVGMTLEKYKDLQLSTEHILSDYKRVLKENEELKEDKINNYRMIALAQNEALGYMQGYEDGEKHKMTAMTQVVENQQYYIIQKQMEKYQEHIKKLQKENEELEEINNELEAEKNEAIRRYNFETIPIKKVKDKIEEYKNMLKTCNKAKDIDRIKAINERILELQELIEGRK